MNYFYYFVLSCSLDLCAACCYYFAVLLRAPHSANTIGGSRRFLTPVASQEPITLIPIRFQISLVPTSHPYPIWYACYLCPVHPISIQFLPFYQLAHKIQFIRAIRYQYWWYSRLISRFNGTNTNPSSLYRFSLCLALVPLILSSESNPTSLP